MFSSPEEFDDLYSFHCQIVNVTLAAVCDAASPQLIDVVSFRYAFEVCACCINFLISCVCSFTLRQFVVYGLAVRFTISVSS